MVPREALFSKEPRHKCALCHSSHYNTDKCQALAAGLRMLVWWPSDRPRENASENASSGGGTRTPDTRIMIPLL